jgi:hypothetical protein
MPSWKENIAVVAPSPPPGRASIAGSSERLAMQATNVEERVRVLVVKVCDASPSFNEIIQRLLESRISSVLPSHVVVIDTVDGSADFDVIERHVALMRVVDSGFLEWICEASMDILTFDMERF